MALTLQKDLFLVGGILRTSKPGIGSSDTKCTTSRRSRTRRSNVTFGALAGQGQAPSHSSFLFQSTIPGPLKTQPRHDSLTPAFLNKLPSSSARLPQDWSGVRLGSRDALVARGAGGRTLGSSDSAGSDGEGLFEGDRGSMSPSLSPASTPRGAGSLSPSTSPTRRRLSPPAPNALRPRSGTRSSSKISALAQATDWAVIEQETSRSRTSSPWSSEDLNGALGARRQKAERAEADSPEELLNTVVSTGNPAVDLTVYNKTLRLQPNSSPAKARKQEISAERVKGFQQRKLEVCVALLEGLHRAGQLNMDEVYHRRFFDECKAAEAVSSAFRFLDLILAASPSLSETSVEEDQERVSEFEMRERGRREKERQRSLLRTINSVIAVCANCADAQGALRAFRMAKQSGVTPDTSLYTTLISALCRASQLDLAFKFFYEMESAGAQPNSHTVCALIDGCGKSKMIAKAFGVYGLMTSKGVRPDRAVYNALITACVRAGATERAFDILEDMRQEKPPVVADCATAGALLSAAFANPQQRDRALEVYREQLQLALGPSRGQGAPGSYVVPEGRDKARTRVEGGGGRSSPVRMFTAAVHACSGSGDWEQAVKIWEDFKAMPKHQVKPDEIFVSAMLDVARHSGKPAEAEAFVEEMQREWGVPVGTAVTSALMSLYAEMGLKDRAMELFDRVKNKVALSPPAFNALISLLCAHGALEEALAVAAEMKRVCGGPDNSTYSLLLEACLRSETTAHSHGDGMQGWVGVEEGAGAQLALKLYQLARKDEVRISLKLCDLMLDLCAAMVAKGAPPPPQELLLSLREGSQSISGERARPRVRDVPPPLSPYARAQGRLGLGQSMWGRPGAQSPYCGRQEQEAPWGESIYRGGAYESASESGEGEEEEAGEFEYTEREYKAHQAQHQFTYRPSARPGGQQRGNEQQQHLSIGSALFPITGWRHLALVVYDHSISSGVVPTLTVLSKILSLLQHRPVPSANSPDPEEDASQGTTSTKGAVGPAKQHEHTVKPVPGANKTLLYHPLAFSIFKEAESLGALPQVSANIGPLTLRLETFPASLAEVCLLSVLRTVEMRLKAAPGLKLFPLSLHLPITSVDLVLPRTSPALAQQKQAATPVKSRRKGQGNKGTEQPRVLKTPTPVRPIQVASKTGQAVGALLRRLGLPFMGYETEGTLHITASALTSWLRAAQSRN